ncbi:MAG: hypothetical protein M3N08_05225 [Pseudomonadota bacterium]|nr:hypothetical protein [Pseudomonadota bacterium]
MLGTALTLLLCATASEVFLRTRILPGDPFWKHVDLFYAAPATDAAFGDSQMARGFTGFKTFVNLAYPADSVSQMSVAAKAFYAHKNPGRVVFEAGPQMLAGAGLEEFPRDYEQIFAEGHKRYAPLGLYILDGYYRSRIVEYFRLKVFPEEDVNRRTVLLPTGGLMNDASMAAMLTPADAKREDLLVQKRVRAHAPPIGFEQSEDARVYQDTIAWLVARGASVCIVTMPVAPIYRATLKQIGYEARFAAALAFYEDLARKRGVTYVSYWDQISDTNLFINADHLNSKGARVVTARMMRDCFGGAPGTD